jgi:hypothetical protein
VTESGSSPDAMHNVRCQLFLWSAKPNRVPVLDPSPGERIDAIVEMNAPGVWVLGEEDDRQRNSGCGVVVEYSGAVGRPRRTKPEKFL